MQVMQDDGLGRGSIVTPNKRLPPDVGANANVRSTVFAHLTGIVLAPTVSALWDLKILEQLGLTRDGADLDAIVRQSGANRAYLRVALRVLESAGWLARKGGTDFFSFTERGKFAMRELVSLYRVAASFAPLALSIEELLFGEVNKTSSSFFRKIAGLVKERWGKPPGQSFDLIARQLDGIVIGPAMVALSRHGVFRQLEKGPVALCDLNGNPDMLSCLFDLLAIQDWVNLERGSVLLTSTGAYAARIASSYGVTVSYLPRLNTLPQLFGSGAKEPRIDSRGLEIFVDREMNVWGSGGAHKTYFKHVDEIVIDIFNRPLAEQPIGICDMGCGDGSFLTHLYAVVRECTARGRVLDQYPLVMVGADYNKVARRVTKQALSRAGIPISPVVFGDINQPARLANDLEKLGYDIHDFFHVRSFLDHNRPYLKPGGYVPHSRSARTTGVFARLGEEISPDELEENLVRHMRSWAPYLSRFGLLVLELHTLPPELTAANLARTPAIAYDAIHGYSDQYLLEVPVFLSCASEAGLRADSRFQALFPHSELATVSLNLFTS